MSEIYEGTYGGPAIHKGKNSEAWKLVKGLMDDNPTAEKANIIHLFKLQARDIPDFVDTALEYYANNQYEGIMRLRGLASSPPKTEQSATISRQQRSERVQEAARKIVTEIKRTILGPLMLPNGKTVNECVGDELIEAGGHYAKLGRAANEIDPTKIAGELFTEEQKQKIVWGE